MDLGFQGGWEDIDFVDSVYADQVSYANAAGPVTVDLATLTATGEGTDTFAATPAGKFTGIVGSPYDDVLTGGPADDQIHGGGGDDTITGGPGDDLLHGDLNWAPDKRNYDTSVPGDDVVEGGAGDDVVEGGHGADILAGEDGEDYLVSAGDAAGTRLDGGPGDDSFATSQQTRACGGDDTFELGIGRGQKADGSRVVNGGNGRDRIQLTSYVGGKNRYDLTIHVPKRRITVGGGLFAKMTGTEEFIRVQKGDGRTGARGVPRGSPPGALPPPLDPEGHVHAHGGGGDDVLIGGYRGDVLDGGPGRDRLDGSRGRDLCVKGEQLRACERR